MATATDDRTAIEYAKCAADAAYACDSYGVIDDSQGHGAGTGTMRFRLWPAQIYVMWLLMTKRLIIILKARQLGISWICCWYALWLCLFHPGKLVLFFSKTQDDADELLRRVTVLYERLPDWYRAGSPALVRYAESDGEAEWANGSRILSLAATKSGGRGHAASLIVLDEAAFQQWASELYTSFKPAIDAGGQLVILSTANGIGNLFHLLWTRAVAGLNDFTTVFLPWWSRPSRDAAWYARQLAEYADPKLVKQEYPASANEAFLVSGRTRFAPEWIEAQAANIRPGLPRQMWLTALQSVVRSLSVYRTPEAGRRYIIGADVAEGLEHGDYDAAVVIDRQTWEEVACLHGHWEPDEYARLLLLLANAYNAAIAVERNNHGHAVIATLKLIGGAHRLLAGADERPGWLTNAQSKPAAIDGLAVALRDGLASVRTQVALDELQIYRIDKHGGTSAPPGYHDDLVMAWAIALANARRPAPQAPAYTAYNYESFS